MSVRRAVALALSAALGITGLTATTAPAPALAAPAASDAPYEVTIDALPDRTPPAAAVLGAGAGVQLSYGGHARWQSLSDGRIAHAPGCDADEPFSFGDVFVCVDPYTEEAVVHDFTTGVTSSRTADLGTTWLPLVSGGHLVRSEPGDGGVTLHFLGYGEDAPADREVFLTGAASEPSVLAQDETGAVLSYLVGEAPVTVLLDFATGTVTPLPALPFAPAARAAALSADRIVLYGEPDTDQAFVLSRTDLGAPGRTVRLSEDGSAADGLLAVVGDWIVSRDGLPPSDDGYDYGLAQLRVAPVAGGTPRDLGVTVLAGASFATGPDGALYVFGDTASSPWGVRRVSPGADGAPVTTQVSVAADQLPTRAGLTLSHGRVVTESETEGSEPKLQGYSLSLTGTHAATPAWNCASLAAAVNCPSLIASSLFGSGRWWAETGDGRLITLEQVNRPASGGQPACSDCAVTVHTTTPGTGGGTRSVLIRYTAPLDLGRLVGVSGRYVHFRAEAGSVTRSMVADIETGAVLRESTNLQQALWGGRLWTAAATGGTLSAVDVRTGATVETADLGTSCPFTGLEVVGKWIYRRCASDPGAVLVYDRETKTPVWSRIPRSSTPRLGDGFLAFPASGMTDSLYVEDVRSGEAEERLVGGLAYDRLDYDGQGWTVDRFGGGVAFIDPWEAVRVVGLGGVTSRLTAIDSDTPAANLMSASWKPRWWLSKPAASWSLSLKHKATGKVVRTLTGGEARGLVAPSWDGKDAAGRFVANGAYTWTLTAKAVDGQGADLSVTGTVPVSGAAAVRRDLAGSDGFGDLLVMDTAGLVSMYRGTGTGTVSAKIAGTGAKFPTTSVFVPTGDLNGDRCADVYARVGDQLRAYRPGCDKVLSASSPYTLVGAGWSPYDVLTSSGDVNGDGYADLIAREASSGDVYFYAGTADHRVKARVRIGTNWKLYKKIVGAGDLNGDGRGDLLGVDASGVLWRYYGTATGGVTARVKVGGGWGGYSSLVGVGDLSGDGRADLLARDTAGRLYGYKGTGTGLYAPRVLIGSGGWNGFKGLY
ncbi:FG-GAP-like repeat-containing protein [Streptomyces sp. NBC_00090]|uniref:FG-GAP-like repeat-containing protein n=1 Tax=Streptomyces sp. NBC_00090 TaxID=2903619 RepID=UPI003246DDEC